MASREDLVYKAKLAEQAERYDEMVVAMNSVAMLDEALTVEERNLLSVGYRNLIGAKRASMRILTSIEQKEETRGNENHVKQATEYRHKVEAELEKICRDVIEIIDKNLIPHSSGAESLVFYYKMKGDYYRYLAEFKMGTEKIEVSELSLKAYEALICFSFLTICFYVHKSFVLLNYPYIKSYLRDCFFKVSMPGFHVLFFVADKQTASKTAEKDLSPTNPGRLGLALNISVLYYEIMNSPEKACQLAKHAFDEAVSELDSLSEESYKDSTLIMQLLRDNLSLWNSDLADDPEDFKERTGKSGDSAVQEGTGNTGA